MANQVDYRDPTPNNFPQDYDPAKVDPRVKLRSESIKHKQKGKHTREAMFQSLEIGATIASEAKTTADKTAESQDNLNQRVDDQISAGTIKDEEIDFRHSDRLKKTFETMRKRGDFYDNEFADRGINVKWYGAAGDGIKDDTAAIQASFDAAHNIFIPAGAYFIDATIGLKPQNNSTIILDERAILKVKTNSSTGYRLFDLENCADINISGGQLVGDADDHNGETGEWGMGIHLENSQNIKIKRMQINKFWGDGIYIGGTGYENRSQNILIDDVTLDANRRQGISVINVEGLKIPKVTITNTTGTSPAAGIDFEPNNNGEVLKNIDIGDLITNNNDHAGVLIVLDALFDDSGKNLYNVDTSQVDIRINKISSRNDLYGLALMSDQTSGYKVYGNILIDALNVENSNSNGIRSENYKTVHTPHVRIAKAYIKNANYSNQFPNHPNGAGLYIKANNDADGSTADNLISYGNIDIDKIEVVDELDNTVRGLHFQVAGEFNVINARIEKYVTNQVLVKQSYIDKFTGTIEQINYLPETLSIITYIENLICHDLIYDLSNSSITLPKASFTKGSTILIRNQDGVTGDKMANIKTASGDLILVSSSGIANGSTNNIMLKSSNGFIKLASLGGTQWLITDSSGYISYPAFNGSVLTYYNNILPTSFPNGAQVGDRVINTVPRSGVPAEWVCTAAGNPGTWIGLNTLN